MKTIRLFLITTALTCILFQFAESQDNKPYISIDTNASCITAECHSQIGKKQYLHKVGVDPNKCRRCHEIITEGIHRFKVIPADVKFLCEECHSKDKPVPPSLKGTPPKVIEENEEVQLHKPFSEGKCTVCHDAHQSDNYRHLKANYPSEPYATYSAETYALCANAECHKGFEDAMSEPRTFGLTMFRNGNLNLHYKHVNKVKGRTCRTCHQHHRSEYARLITSSFTFGSRTLTNEYDKTNTGGSCKTTCHKTANYDRYEPAFNVIKTTPSPGNDATVEELKLSKERDIEEGKIKKVESVN